MAGNDERPPLPPWGPERGQGPGTRRGEQFDPFAQGGATPIPRTRRTEEAGPDAPAPRPFARELGEEEAPETAAPAPGRDGSAPGDRHFPCASCGADLIFAPGQSELVCPYCGHAQPIPAAARAARAAALRELDYRAAVENRLPPADTEDKHLTRCPNCGAEVAMAANVHADRCPFCDTALVTDTGVERLIKPQAVLPFVVGEEDARQRMVAWLGQLWFAPRGLQQYASKARRLSGVYVPYFTFDAATRTRYQGQRGTAYVEMQTVTTTVNGRQQRVQQPVQKIRWTPVSGQAARRFDDVLVLASTGLPRREAEELTPWNLTALQPYEPAYLAGFRAESYTVELAEAHDNARRQMDAVILSDIRRDIGGDAQQIGAADTQASEETFKHILLPVWTAAYKYGGRSFTFVVNGQTGEVQGERPYSSWKIAAAVVAGLILAAVVFYLTTELQ